ncbi:MAG: FN3 associated domain-containing protein [Verrucomicrobiota bacterium]
MKSQLLFVVLGIGSVLPSAAQTVDSVITNRLAEPYNVAVEANVYYLSDSANDRIVKFVPDSGAFSTLAGFAGRPGTTDAKGVLARFFNPRGLVSAPSRGGLVVADYGNHTLRLVKADGTVTTLAGTAGSPGFEAGEVAAVSAHFNFPSALAVDGSGHIYIADSKNNAIRKLDGNNRISTVAVGLNEPNGLAAGDNGDLWIADSRSHTIKLLRAGGSLQVIAGFSGQSGYADSIFANETLFNNPAGLVWLGGGKGLLVADSGNHALRLVSFDPEINGYSVDTFAGSPPQPGFIDGALRQARFKIPTGLSKDPTGGFLVADLGNNALRRVQTSPPLPPVANPVLGYVTFEKDQFGELLAKLVPVTAGVFNNDVTIAIISEAATETYYTYGPTPPSDLEDIIPAPNRLTGNSPPAFRNGMTAAEVPGSIVSPQPDLTIKAIGSQDGRRPSSVVQARFQFKTANPSIIGNNAASFTVSSVTQGAQLWYTTDGTDPEINGPTSTLVVSGRVSLSRSPSPIQFRVRAFRDNYRPSEIVNTTFSPDDYEANTISFGFGQGEGSSEFIGAPGQTFYAPVTLLLLPQEKMYTLQYGLTVKNSNGTIEPELLDVGFDSMLVEPIQTSEGVRYRTIPPVMFLGGQQVPPEFQADDPLFGQLQFTNASISLLGVGWLERGGAGKTNLYNTLTQDLITYSMAHDTIFLSALGRVVTGGYHFQIPVGATSSDTYRIEISRPSATSDGLRQSVYIEVVPDPAKSISSTKVVRMAQRRYVVGDVDQFRWFNAGDFGDGSLMNVDVVQVFQSAIYGLNRPPSGVSDLNPNFGIRGDFNRSDFFDAMDSSNGVTNQLALIPGFVSDVTINDIQFGDGYLNVDDVYVTFRRSLDSSLKWYERYWEGGVRRASEVPNLFRGAPNQAGQRLTTQSAPSLPGEAFIAGQPSVAWSVEDTQVNPGQTLQVPIHSRVLGEYPLRVLLLDLAVEALDGAPQIAQSVQFTPAASIGEPILTSARGPSEFGGAWLNNQVPGIAGDGVVGHLTIAIPSNAPPSAAYRVHFAHASGSPNGVGLLPQRVQDGLLTFKDRSGSSLGDTIPDSWRLRYFGSVSNAIASATADADGDGVSNLAEFKAGTNPADRTSQLHLAVQRADSVSNSRPFTLRWSSVLNKTYVVESAASLSSSTWDVLAADLVGTGAEMQLTPSELGNTTQFFRVRVAGD